MYTFQSCKTLLVDLAISANLQYTNDDAVYFGDTSHSPEMIASRQRSLFSDWQLLQNLGNMKN